MTQNDPEDVPDGDLPGMWTHSDFMGGIDVIRGPDGDEIWTSASSLRLGEAHTAAVREPLVGAIRISNIDDPGAPTVDLGWVPTDRSIVDAFEPQEPFVPDGFLVDWREPIVMTLEAKMVHADLLMAMFGLDPRPMLCQQQIPAEGQE